MNGPRVVAMALLASACVLLGVAVLDKLPTTALVDRDPAEDTGAAADAPLDRWALDGDDAPSLVDLARSLPVDPLPGEAAPGPDEPRFTEHTIGRGEALGLILPRFGLPTAAVLAAAKPHHDLSRIRAGKVLRFKTEPGAEAPSELHYALDQDRTLVVYIDEEAESGWSARVDEVTYDTKLATREFEVTSTLWAAAVEAGLQPADIAGLAGVYRFDLDFNTEVRAGARVRMVVEELWTGGEFVRLGTPVAVELTNSGKEYVAIHFQDRDNEPAYYDAQGRARKKAFLRSPLKFSRVTSGFNKNRYHPVLKRKRPHYGVDFGAPTGTPVHAVGDGVVSLAGTHGGHGRHVKLDHAGPYESSYSHLSRIAVKRGQKVRQGQIIGYVGSTGLATGPHLHYQFWVDGKYVNPLTVKLPSEGTPAIQDTSGFAAWRDHHLSLLDEDDGSVVADAQ